MSKQPFVEVDGVLRPALNSEGRMIHPTPQGVISFWRWFGGSKVVDKKKRPLVVYHGSEKAGFKAFDMSRAGSSAGRKFSGAYFSSGLRGAATYSGTSVILEPLEEEDDRHRGNYAVYLKILDPYTADFRGKDWSSDIEGGAFQGIDELTSYAKDAGMDGVIAKRINDEGRFGQGYAWDDKTFVVFSPTQIKSATGNRGTFDPSDPVITNPPRYPAMPYAAAHAWEKQAAARGVSAVARSHRGFMRAYEDAGSFAKLSPWWKRRREGFLARHIAQAIRGENIWERTRSGTWRPTRRSLSLIMWGFMPPKKPAGCRPGAWE